jgi:hypothetical protein
MNNIRMLTVLFPIRRDNEAQDAASTVANGFGKNALEVLANSPFVIDARICSIPDPNDRTVIASILLATTYTGTREEYFAFFLARLPAEFSALALATGKSLADLPTFVEENDRTGSHESFPDTPFTEPSQFVDKAAFCAVATIAARPSPPA